MRHILEVVLNVLRNLKDESKSGHVMMKGALRRTISTKSGPVSSAMNPTLWMAKKTEKGHPPRVMMMSYWSGWLLDGLLIQFSLLGRREILPNAQLLDILRVLTAGTMMCWPSDRYIKGAYPSRLWDDGQEKQIKEPSILAGHVSRSQS